MGKLKHIAIIMDGNGRWALARKMSRPRGHKKGAEAVKQVIEGCIKLGIPYLTLYAFSSENWKRPKNEVQDLMQLLRYYLDHELANFHKNGVQLKVIGDRQRLDKDILKRIDDAESLTGKNTKLHLNIALSYGSRQEIIRAAVKLAEDIRHGYINPDEVDEHKFAEHLYTHDMPDPDLLIRTGGEQRMSNFLLWQSAYTELYFTDLLWPDFSQDSLKEAVEEFHRRQRRFGATGEQVEAKEGEGASGTSSSTAALG
jgi:undecaprenyl diphosphate synthase